MLIDFIERTLYRRNSQRNLFVSLAIDISAILLWRGVWGLLDLYAFPNHPERSFIFSTALGLVSLILIRVMTRR